MELGCTYMFENRKIEQLTLMYAVFLRVETTLKYMITKMDPFIMDEGRKIIKNKECPDPHAEEPEVEEIDPKTDIWVLATLFRRRAFSASKLRILACYCPRTR